MLRFKSPLVFSLTTYQMSGGTQFERGLLKFCIAMESIFGIMRSEQHIILGLPRLQGAL